MAGELLDLVCGPASPLPETYQRYRLVAHLGSGGQAEVYRAVRLCGGVTSAPVTVKVFRVDPARPLADELRSWDKGDAALMDLNNRGVSGICRRADGFYGPPPHRPGVPPQSGNAVPYQVYDYLHGVNLRNYLLSAGAAGPGPRLSAVAALRTLAEVLNALHHPADPVACPVLHMDIKPSNVMVLATGGIRLIDFTGARYWRTGEITQIAYTPQAGGPEARQGRVGPAYDVHGFGSVAYFLVTGAMPRGQDGAPGQHPVLSGHPVLRDTLLAPLADQPSDRPMTAELFGWVEGLAALVRSAGVPENGVDWAEPETGARVVGRAAVVAGTETDAAGRIERLERELVALRDLVAARPVAASPGRAVPTFPMARMPELMPAKTLMPATVPMSPVASIPTTKPMNSNMPVSPAPLSPAPRPPIAEAGTPDGPAGDGPPRGRASVPSPRPEEPEYADRLPQPVRPPRPPLRERMRLLRRGGGWTWVGVSIAVLGWGVWFVANRGKNPSVPVLGFVLALVVAAGLFVMLRLIGRLVVERWFGRRRRGAVLAHLGTAAFLVAVGLAYLAETPWVAHLIGWR